MTQQTLFQDKPVRDVPCSRAHNPLALPVPSLHLIADYCALLDLNPCMDANDCIPRGSTYSVDASDAIFVCGHDWVR